MAGTGVDFGWQNAPVPSAGTLTPETLILALRAVVDFWDHLKRLREWLANSSGYEILDYDSTLELLDPAGETAIFKRHQKVRFLQDNVIAYQDHAWGAPRGAVWIMSEPTPRERRIA